MIVCCVPDVTYHVLDIGLLKLPNDLWKLGCFCDFGNMSKVSGWSCATLEYGYDAVVSEDQKALQEQEAEILKQIQDRVLSLFDRSELHEMSEQ